MYYQRILVLAVLAMVFASSCKKDDDGDGPIDTTCTETREFWMDGTINGESLVTSEPCGNLRMKEIEVKHGTQGTDMFTFTTLQSIVDSNNNKQGEFLWIIGAKVPMELIDTAVTDSGNVYSLTANNICKVMKPKGHYLYQNVAQQNNTNSYYLTYTDADGTVWQPILAQQADTNMVVTSLDGIVSQNPFSGAYFPYCTIRFSYDVLMIKSPDTGDTLHLSGTGRLGFR